MKKHFDITLLHLIGLFLIGLLATCKQPEPNVPAAVVGVAMPKLVLVSMPDVPASNIVIDTIAKTVQITLPENYSVVSPQLSISFICPQCTVGSKSGNLLQVVSLGSIGTSNPPLTGSVFIAEAVTDINVRYTYTIQPTGTFSVAQLVDPVTAEAGDYLNFPGIQVRNFLDGQRTESVLTNVATGERVKSITNFCKSSFRDCTNLLANRIYINTAGVLPGTYDLTLTKADGRQVTVPRAIMVVPGTPRIDAVSWGVVGTPLLISGVNLYDNFKPDLTLVNRKGLTVRVLVSGYDERKGVATGQLPVTAQPGGYVARLTSLRGGSVVNEKVHLLRFANQPILQAVGTSRNDPQLNAYSRTLVSGTTYTILFTQHSPVKKDRLVFASVGQDAATFEVPIAIPAAFYIYGPDGGGNTTFTLPISAPPGRYRISLRLYDSETTYRESEPLDQEFTIQ